MTWNHLDSPYAFISKEVMISVKFEVFAFFNIKKKLGAEAIVPVCAGVSLQDIATFARDCMESFFKSRLFKK